MASVEADWWCNAKIIEYLFSQIIWTLVSSSHDIYKIGRFFFDTDSPSVPALKKYFPHLEIFIKKLDDARVQIICENRYSIILALHHQSACTLAKKYNYFWWRFPKKFSFQTLRRRICFWVSKLPCSHYYHLGVLTVLSNYQKKCVIWEKLIWANMK